MTQEKKLEALVHEATEHGFDLEKFAKEMGFEGFLKGSPYQRFLCSPRGINIGQAYATIFNHDFAKALFGERQEFQTGDATVSFGDPWKWHLQIAVVSEDPISYMYSVVFGEKE